MAHVNPASLILNGNISDEITWLQVAPSNIEKQLLTHPGVEDVGVVGLPHDVDGELPVAFVVLRSGWNVTSHELIQHANGESDSSPVFPVDCAQDLG